jgi:hypothetical protein
MAKFAWASASELKFLTKEGNKESYFWSTNKSIWSIINVQVYDLNEALSRHIKSQRKEVIH